MTELMENLTPGGAIEISLMGGFINRSAVAAELRVLHDRGLAVEVDEESLFEYLQEITQGQYLPQHGDQGWNLDPNLPLMQLFLGTLMPWNHFDGNAAPALLRRPDLPPP